MLIGTHVSRPRFDQMKLKQKYGRLPSSDTMMQLGANEETQTKFEMALGTQKLLRCRYEVLTTLAAKLTNPSA